MTHLPDIKLQLAMSEMEMLNELLAHNANKHSISAEQKMIISIIRDIHSRFVVPQYSIPKKSYTRKLKYHEAYTLQKILLNTSIIGKSDSHQYYHALINGIIHKIDKQL